VGESTAASDLRLPEGRIEDGNTRLEKLNLEDPIRNGPELSDQLIHPGLGHGAIASLVHIEAVCGTRRPPIDEQAKSH
jgi:hypothetical protein